MSDRCFRAATAGILFIITSCDSTSTEPEVPRDPLRVAHVGQINPGGSTTPKSDVWGYVDASTGKEYALLGAWGTDALFVIDASDAANPVTVAISATRNALLTDAGWPTSTDELLTLLGFAGVVITASVLLFDYVWND